MGTVPKARPFEDVTISFDITEIRVAMTSTFANDKPLAMELSFISTSGGQRRIGTPPLTNTSETPDVAFLVMLVAIVAIVAVGGIVLFRPLPVQALWRILGYPAAASNLLDDAVNEPVPPPQPHTETQRPFDFNHEVWQDDCGIDVVPSPPSTRQSVIDSAVHAYATMSVQ
ncbi:hypothetical protein H310_01579 [Aphanomyces invadans]|uniref:Uncharacterized protein n=1 Tax=Aphanomyces invadans TaxID=157072 RepID=A0A024US39_9STRA|nr:hypothetical protein H310_01579 [Aphanomyces invadans]ETW09144.1 hypothetical protein H310_01579 [Aphanomyces invadans]|eukprot:XP_008862949.1 hypothetical protein H310_01579 [Aphanomyces invadans]